MKKFISAVLAASFAVSSAGIVLAEDSMESILVSVKNKVSVPDGFTEFNTYHSTEEDGIESYSFSWSEKDGNGSLNVETDGYGNIIRYSRYSDSFDYDYDDESFKIDKNFKFEDVTTVSDKLIHSLVPNLFEFDSDKLVQLPYDGKLDVSNYASYTIRYERKYHDVTVKDNGASVTVSKTKDGFAALRADIDWDYTKEFLPVPDNYKAMGKEAAEKAIDDISPLKLQYRKTYDDKYSLEYVRNGFLYIDAATGQKLEEAENNRIMYSSDAQNAKASEGDMGGGNMLTPAERTEIENMSGLKSVDELFGILLSRPELGVSKNTDRSKLSSNTFKSDNEYYTSMYINESEEGDNYSSISAYFNAKTGEMTSFYRFTNNYTGKEEKSDEKAAYNFLNKYYKNKLSECGELSETKNYRRMVNNIEYQDNYLSARYNAKTGRIDSFDMQWDSDVSKMPKPENIISAEEASKAVFNKYPAKLLYIISTESDNMFTLCYTQGMYDIRVNAFDGKFSNTDLSEENYTEYDDVENHWIKNIADTLCKYGIRLDGKSLNPDEKITQGDFLKLAYSGIFGYSLPDTYEPVYRTMVRRKVISDKETNSKDPITREAAVRYLLRAMGIKEVAEIKGIYICDFDDADKISPDKIGYCAIAKGLKIVNGFDNKLNPTENITRAEALTMVYNYLTR